MEASDQPLQIFCSFAAEDAEWCDQLHAHLRLWERQGRLQVWHARLITPGTDWAKAVDEQLAQASLIVLLISPDFFASDYSYGVEMQRALLRHEAGEARVIPLLIRPVNWQDAPFAHLAVLPANQEPVTHWSDRDAALEAASPADERLARAISEDLGGLPLALDQAGAYIEETQCGLARYRQLYRSRPIPLLKRRGSSDSDYPASVATTWSLSFARVEQQNPLAAELLRCCAFLAPDAIPAELWTKGGAHLGPALSQRGEDPLAFDEAVRLLLSYPVAPWLRGHWHHV